VAVLPYIADLKPESGLAPKRGSAERYRLLEWIGFLGSEIHKNHKPFFNPEATDKEKSAATAKIKERYDLVAKTLEKQPFLMGERFSAADAYLFVMLTWISKTGLVLTTWPALQEFHQKVAGRASVKHAQEMEKSA